MTLQDVKLIGLSFLLIALFFLLNFNFMWGYSLAIISSFILGSLSVYFVYKSLANNNRNILIWNIIIFCISIIIFINQYYIGISIAETIIPGILFCGGLIFFMLFIQNPVNKSLFYPSITLFLLFTVYIFAKDSLIVNRINEYISILLNYKLFILILISFYLIWHKRQSN
ncbi:MAG TPA: hypothetical protein PL041_12590 [Melioribacteraceae bacterium]|nr:hypothetical protein [Melioribacteraceae bacterium]